MSAQSGWEAILDDGETVLWQGRPNARITFRPRDYATFLFGLAFAGFALFWMVMASSAGGLFWSFGLIHFSVGLGLAVGPPFWNAFVRRHTWYTLSDRRAIIATDKPFAGKRLKSYPITSDTVLNFEPGDLATIHFSQEARRGNKGRNYTVDIGFERVDGGDELYRLMRGVQKDRGHNATG